MLWHARRSACSVTCAFRPKCRDNLTQGTLTGSCLEFQAELNPRRMTVTFAGAAGLLAKILRTLSATASGYTMTFPMLWIRGLIFTALIPAVVGFFLPAAVDPLARRAGGIWDLGWGFITVGLLVYALCFIRFLLAGGTPAIFFSRHLRFLIGEEPGGLVLDGLYRFSRNPMYAGVLMVVFGQAVLFASLRLTAYGCAVFAFFHMIVVFAEEPHLRATRGPSYDVYCRTVPRWLGMRRRKPEPLAR